MINIQPSHIVRLVTQNQLASPTQNASSPTIRVIEVFHKRLKDAQTFPAPSQQSDTPLPAYKRIEQLLGYAVTQEQPSLGEQISRLVENSPDPLTDAALAKEVEQRLNQPSAINSQNTYAQLIQEILAGSPPRKPNMPPALALLHRQPRDTSSTGTTRNAAARQFADALIDSGDRQLALGVANSLIRQRLAAETGHSSGAEDNVAVPADSTFGQAWAELADALHSEPFKSFAEARTIDISKLVIAPNGHLIEMRDGRPTQFSLHQNADWAAASGTVLAAVRKVAGDTQGAVLYYSRDQAAAHNIASFYGLQLGQIKSDHTLSSIGRLLREGTFNAFSNTDPNYTTVYATINQQRREAVQRIADLPSAQLNQRLAPFTPSPMAKKVQEADRTLAQQCSQGLIKLVPQARDESDGFQPMLHEIPEYSSFNQARKNLLAALTGSAFTTFARENSVDPASVSINPVTGDLRGTVRGVDTTFVLNDVSGWDGAWEEIKSAVQLFAAGSNTPVSYPLSTSASLYDVMNFYNEQTPLQPNMRTSDWRQRQLIRLLDRSTVIVNNNGFNALVNTKADDARSIAVRERQSTITQQLMGTSAPLSELESLAAMVKSSTESTVSSVESSEDRQANADRTLAIATHHAMQELKNEAAQASSKMIDPIPTDSLLGQWRSYLSKALTGRGFADWAGLLKIDLASLRFDPNGQALIGKANGVEQRFTSADVAKNHPEHFDVFTSVLNAARIFAHTTPITLAHANSSSVPLNWVCNFYGISASPNSQAFERSLGLLKRTERFPKSPKHPQQVMSWLNQQKNALGDSNDRYALIQQLKNGNIDNDDTTRFIVDQDSAHRPKGVTTVQRYLADHGWFEAKSAAQAANLLQALQTPLPQAPALGNSWGFLSTDVALGANQRDAVRAFVRQSIGTHPNLLSYLGAQVPHLSTSSPAQALDQLLSSDSALELATNLQTEMRGVQTPISLKQWLLTALVLELDATAGTSRNTLAGFDLMHSDNWGLDAGKISERFERHLTDNRKIPPHLAPAAAHLLMVGGAPHLLVNDVPPAVTLGSTDWVSFMTAVNRIELNAAGATPGMSFEHVMKLHRISPISADETRHLAIAQANPVMDWAIANNHVVRNDKDEYSLEQFTNSQQKLNTQMDEIADARRFLHSAELPNRRTMALAALREKWGTDIDYERPCLTEKLGPGGILSGIRASIVDVYEAGRLGESWRWETTGPDFETLRAHASELPDINARFESDFEADFALRRNHTITLFKNMLSQLPEADRKSINNGSVSIYRMAGASEGFMLISSHNEENRAFAIYPQKEKIVPVPGIGQQVPIGKTGSQTIATDAFQTETGSKPGIQSDLVLTLIDQGELVDSNNNKDGRRFLFAHSAGHSPITYESLRTQHVAEVLVDSVYLNKSAVHASQRGLSNNVENGLEPSDYFQKALQFLPGGSSLVDIYRGKYADAVKDLAIDIVIYAATEGAGKLWNVAKTGARWTAAKASATFIEKMGADESASIVLKDATNVSTLKSFTSVNRLQGGPLAEQVGGEIIPTADRADGALIRPGSAGQIKLTAVHQDGKWYAYDAKIAAAYGPALEDFVSDTSSRLRQETFTDGTQALVVDKSLAADAYTLPRTHGFDLVNEGKVYRYDTRNPGVLSDLESADHFKPLEGFDAICPAPALGEARVRRGASDTCFSKVITNVSGELAQELQALEHQRLFPSNPSLLSRNQYVIFERRRYKMVDGDSGPQLIPTPENKRIVYKSKISGSLKPDPEFGFYHAKPNDALAQETRVVKLNAISDACNDKREVRGVIVKDPAAGSTTNYLVIEADTAEFYYAKLNDVSSGELTFNKCTPAELSLVQQYRNTLSLRQGVAKVPFDANFIALPKLNTAFTELESLGYPKQDIHELKTACADFTQEQQREVVYQLQRSRAIDKANIALKPNRVSTLTKPADFNTWSPERQNEFYARQAKDSVNRSLKATGLGPSNQIRSKADVARAEAAQMTNAWIRRTVPYHAPNRSDLILKTGAGNCGEMALLSKDIIRKSGGRAYEWVASDAHVFTVIGGPSTLPAGTVDFSEAAWADAWIVDPWADIACPARQYTTKLSEVMVLWDREKLKIVEGSKPMSPLDQTWLDKLIVKPKIPYSHGYNL